MAARTKGGYNPNPAIYGDPQKLDLPDNLFEGCQTFKYSSKYFADDSMIAYFQDLYKRYRKDGRGKLLFPDEDQFLRELDAALTDYEMFLGCVTATVVPSLAEQRTHFNELKEDEERLSSITIESESAYTTRLLHAGFDKDKSNDPAAFKTAVLKVCSELKGKNCGNNPELHLLVEVLSDMLMQCSGRKAGWTDNSHNPDNKGVFVEFIKSIAFVAGISIKLKGKSTPESVIAGFMRLNNKK